MAGDLNKAMIIGRLGADPETRYMPSGSAVTEISVATGDKWKDKQTGETKERTEWHRVVFFGRIAEIAAEYLRKGSQVYIEGRIQTDKYEKDGVTKYTTKIIAGNMQMLGSRSDAAGARPPQPSAPPAPKDEFDDDIPF